MKTHTTNDNVTFKINTESSGGPAHRIKQLFKRSAKWLVKNCIYLCILIGIFTYLEVTGKTNSTFSSSHNCTRPKVTESTAVEISNKGSFLLNSPRNTNVHSVRKKENYQPVPGVELNARNEMKDKKGNSVKPILTLFTTFKNSSKKKHIFENTLRVMSMLRPDVIPVLFTMTEQYNMSKTANDYGVNTHDFPFKGVVGLPILRHMYIEAQKRYDTPFYAYANGDILFEKGLVKTLKSIMKYYEDLNKGALICGRRFNYQMRPFESVTSLDHVKNMTAKARLYFDFAMDYFITPRDGYPWKQIPDFVVGRVIYDNWLLFNALHKQFRVIDATNTIIAIHQTDTDGNQAGAKTNNGTVYANKPFVAPGFKPKMGRVACTQFETYREKTKIKIRRKLNNTCAELFGKDKEHILKVKLGDL